MKMLICLLILWPTILLAQGAYSIKERTPEVEQALNNRRDRFESLKTFKSQGIIGENNKGYVQLLKEDAVAKDLVNAENRDRQYIYQAIVNQNNLGQGALVTVEGVFADVQYEKALSGEMVQTTDGQWVRK